MKLCIFGKKNKILVLILALVIMAEFFLPQKTVLCAGSGYMDNVTDASGLKPAVNTSEIKAVIEKTFERIRITDEIVENAGTSDCDWLAFSIGRYTDAFGRAGDFGDLEAYRDSLCRYVCCKYSENGVLHRNKATEWHRISLAMLACGGNPEMTVSGTAGDIGPINLIADGTYGCVTGAPWRQGVNGAIYALITLDSMNYSVPDGAVYSRDDMIHYIISQELDGGGFSLAGNMAAKYDTDVTAMAIQALAGYYDSRDDVRHVVDRSLACLQDGFGNDASYGNAASTAQVLLALTSVGIDVTSDERFITEDGHNIIDGIMNYYDEDEAMFCLTKNTGPGFMATTQCIYALTGWCRQADGFSSLYDFGKISGKPETPPDTGTTHRPYTTPEPDTKTNLIQTQMPYGDNIESKAEKKIKAENKKKNTKHTKKDKTKTEDNTKIDRKKTVKFKTNKSKAERLKNDIDTETNIDNSKDKAVSRKDNPEKSEESERTANDIIIKRDDAYVTEQELGSIIGTDSNILIDSVFDGEHRCLITINGADVNTCRYMNLKASAGSGNDAFDGNIMDMASDAFIFNVEDGNGIVCDALYSIETSLSPGDYLLMKYEDGGADYVDKVNVEDGYLRFVIDSPGIYFVCTEVRRKNEAKVIQAGAAGIQFEKYAAGAALAAVAGFIFTAMILKGKRKNNGN